jgi:heme exporter protein D
MTTIFPGTHAQVRAAPAAMHRGAGCWHAVAVLLGSFFMLTAHAAKGNDPYLQAINTEGDRLESLGKAQEEHAQLERLQSTKKKVAATAPATNATAAPTNLQGFETALRDSFPGSFALYSLMDATEKGQVYAEYQKKKSDGLARFTPVVVKIIAITNSKRASVNAK